MDPLLYEFLGIGGNEYPTTNKTEDEIKRLTLEEDMNEVKRTVHILFRGQQIQKPAIYFNLHKILLEPDAFLKIMPLLSEGIISQNEETQIEAAKGFIKLIKNNKLDQTKLIDIFNLTMNTLNLWSQPVLDAWVLLFVELLHILPYNVIGDACEMSIDNLSEQSQHPQSKYIAARMTGFLAEYGIKPTKPLFDRMRFLCQDSEVEVRRVLAEEVIVKICRNVGDNLTENKYLEKLLELIYDSDTIVKLSAIDSVVEILDMLSLSYRKTRMVQVMFELMNSFNEDVTKKMSFLVGKILYKLEDIILENQTLITQVEGIIKEWLSQKNPEIKQNIVYNIPYLIRVLTNKGLMKDLYFKATRDHDVEIRKIAISSFLDVVKAFEHKEAQNLFKDTFEVILREEDVEILEKIIPLLPEIIPKFQPSQEEEAGEETNRGKEKEDNLKNKIKESLKLNWKEYRDTETDKSGQSTKVNSKESLDQKSYLEDLCIMGNLLNKKHAWRLEILFMETMNKCIIYFELKDFGEFYVNFLIKEIERGNKSVRKCAIDSLILFLKKNHYLNKTNDIMKKTIDLFSTSASFQGRLAFLEFYEACAENFSRQFFKAYNLNELALNLAQDKVVEVRKKFLQNAVVLRKMIENEDKGFLTRFESTLLKNITDQNKTVSIMAKSALKEMKSLTKLFYDEFNTEDALRLRNEERLKEKEKEEIEANKRKQQEMVLKGRTESLKAALGTLILGGKKMGKKTFWSDNNQSKLAKGSQSATLCQIETPKCKPTTPLLTLPALKTQKNIANLSHINEKEADKPKIYKARIPKHLIVPIGQIIPKKKSGSICLEAKEKSYTASTTNTNIDKKEQVLERVSSKGKYLLTEPAPRHSLDIRPNKLNLARDSIERGIREKPSRVPSLKKKV